MTQNKMLFNKVATYAAYMELDRILKENGDLPHGIDLDVSGVTVELTIPNGTSVVRDSGENGDGKILKTATQNLYGYAVLNECFKLARKFKQHKKLERILRHVVRKALKNAISSEEALAKSNPKLAQEIKELKKSLNLPKRVENTPRKIVRLDKEKLPAVAVRKPAPAKAA